MTELVYKQFDALADSYSGLTLTHSSGHWAVSGKLHFSADYQGKEIQDTFEVCIQIPDDYPQSPPEVQEIDGRIPRNMDNHIYSNGNFCLGAPLEVKRRFKENASLLSFVNDLVIPFLFSFSYKERNAGVMPFGELSHGGKGLLEYYQNIFGSLSIKSTLRLLKLLADDHYRGHFPCPCGSGENLRRCHGFQLRELMEIHSAQTFFDEMDSILRDLPSEEAKSLTVQELPEKIIKTIKLGVLAKQKHAKKHGM